MSDLTPEPRRAPAMLLLRLPRALRFAADRVSLRAMSDARCDAAVRYRSCLEGALRSEDRETAGVADIVYRVVVRRGLDAQALEALARFGATYISGHGGPGYESSSILVHADSEEQARDKIEAALGEHA